MPRNIFQGSLITIGIGAHFALIDQTLLVPVEKFDRVFDGDDVFPRVFIAIVQHRCHRGRLAAAGAAQKNDQPTFGHGNVVEQRRQLQFLNGGDPLLHQTQHHPGAAALGEGADPEAGDIGKIQGKIEFMMLVKFPCLVIVHDRAHQQRSLLWRQLPSSQRVNFLFDLERRRAAGGDKNV